MHGLIAVGLADGRACLVDARTGRWQPLAVDAGSLRVRWAEACEADSAGSTGGGGSGGGGSGGGGSGSTSDGGISSAGQPAAAVIVVEAPSPVGAITALCFSHCGAWLFAGTSTGAVWVLAPPAAAENNNLATPSTISSWFSRLFVAAYVRPVVCLI